MKSINPKVYAERCLRDEAQALLDLIPQLDDSFDKVVELMHRCSGHVVVTGVGKSGHVGAKIAATLASTGTPAFYLNALDALHGDLGMIQDDDKGENIFGYGSEQIENKFTFVNENGGIFNSGIYVLYYDKDLTIKEAQ